MLDRIRGMVESPRENPALFLVDILHQRRRGACRIRRISTIGGSDLMSPLRQRRSRKDSTARAESDGAKRGVLVAEGHGARRYAGAWRRYRNCSRECD